MASRPKRRLTIKSEDPISVPRKWRDEEMDALFNCLIKHGHKNLDKIQEYIPNRSIENIKTFMRTVLDTSGKLNDHKVLDIWMNRCNAISPTPWKDSLQIAQILKYLSVDGLLENHPIPEKCQGINFGLAYRLVYQAMMGYPIQAVNQETADFVFETLAELNFEIKKQTDVIKKVDTFVNKKEEKTQKPIESNTDVGAIVKPLRVYQRKKPNTTNTAGVPSLKINIEEGPRGSGSGSFKDFSVSVEGNESTQSTTVNVPVPCEKVVDEDEQELLKSSSYNPFKIPNAWLEEPLYINITQKV